MVTSDSATSVLTQRDLDLFCSTYNIPVDLRPKLSSCKDTIKNSLAGKIASVKKDPLPYDDLVDFELLEKLNTKRTIIRRYPKLFLCLVGLSHSFDDPLVHPTLLKFDENDMGLLDFMKSVDSFKVKTLERTIDEGEVPLLTETADMVVAPSAHIVRLVDHIIVNELEEHIGKKKRKVVFNAPPSQPGVKKARTRSVKIFEPIPTIVEEFVFSFVIHTPKPDVPEDSGSTQDMNSPSQQVKAGNTNVEFTDRAEASFIPRDNAGTSTSMSDEGSPIDEFFESQTIDSATAQDVYEAAEVSGLCGRVSELEAEAAAKSEEFIALNKQNVELLGNVSVLESAREELSGQTTAWRFEERSAALDASINEVRRDMDTDLCPHILTTIAAEVISLVINKGIQNKYVAAVGELENVSFYVLEELKAFKDFTFALIMSALTLECDANFTPELRKLQPSLDQVTIPVYYEFDGPAGAGSVSHEMLLSDAIRAIRGRVENRGLGSFSRFMANGTAAIVLVQDSSIVVDY
uniref:Transposase (Putative), gypsy type n=1 Tax=Tanacetum cinerariifolium TaxID=118510 RepID=A0A699GSF1_TANCI|nr:hypothetical protein [Tanacetum cinerariifolium]